MADDRIRFLKHAIKHKGKRYRVHYSTGELINFPKGTVTIYARDYSFKDGGLPKELNPKNDTDIITDYFEKDRARITPDNRYFKDIMKLLKKRGLD